MEQYFDQARSAFESARKNVGWGLYKTAGANGRQSNKKTKVGAKPSSKKVVRNGTKGRGKIRPQLSGPDRLARAEILMQRAELELFYGQQGTQAPCRRLSMRESAFSDIRTAAELATAQGKAATRRAGKLKEGCIRLTPDETLALRIRFRYGDVLAALMVELKKATITPRLPTLAGVVQANTARVPAPLRPHIEKLHKQCIATTPRCTGDIRGRFWRFQDV